MNSEIRSAPFDAGPLPLVPSIRRPRRWVSLLLSLVIFCCGLAIGTGATLISIRNQALYQIHHPEEAAPHIAARIGRQLKLTPEQLRQVEEIIRARQLVLQEIRRDVQPRVEVELNHVEQQIAGVLDDRQREVWRSTCERLRKTWIPPMPGAENAADNRQPSP